MLLDAADLRSVLVVEDCDDDFDTVRVAAARARVPNRLVRAADAEMALHLLGCGPVGLFAFMLLDYSLPGLDGLALLQQLRRDDPLGQLPVVVFTTSINPRDRDAFCAAGASAFHVKDLQYPDCLRTLDLIFDQWLHRKARPNGAAVVPPIQSSTQPLKRP